MVVLLFGFWIDCFRALMWLVLFVGGFVFVLILLLICEIGGLHFVFVCLVFDGL